MPYCRPSNIADNLFEVIQMALSWLVWHVFFSNLDNGGHFSAVLVHGSRRLMCTIVTMYRAPSVNNLHFWLLLLEPLDDFFKLQVLMQFLYSSIRKNLHQCCLKMRQSFYKSFDCICIFQEFKRHLYLVQQGGGSLMYVYVWEQTLCHFCRTAWLILMKYSSKD